MLHFLNPKKQSWKVLCEFGMEYSNERISDDVIPQISTPDHLGKVGPSQLKHQHIPQ